MLNYHELTINEPRNSPARRLQFLLITTMIVGYISITWINAGGLYAIKITRGELMIGDPAATTSTTASKDGDDKGYEEAVFIYKQTQRDYATAPGLARFIMDDVKEQIQDSQQWEAWMSSIRMYTIYFDDPSHVKGGDTRFAVGLMLRNMKKDGGDDTAAAETATTTMNDWVISHHLLSKNADIIPPTSEELLELPVGEIWAKLPYKQSPVSLKLGRKTDAVITQFPCTDGFASSLLMTWRVLPALYSYWRGLPLWTDTGIPRDDPIVVISVRNVTEKTCTFYVPIISSGVNPFFLGLEPTSRKAKYPPTTFTVTFLWDWLKATFPIHHYFVSSKSEEEF